MSKARRAMTGFRDTRLKNHDVNQKIMVAITIGDPAIVSGGGNILFLYGGIIAGIAASILLWWYLNHRKKV